jgi:CRISPR-associated protein Csb1
MRSKTVTLPPAANVSTDGNAAQRKIDDAAVCAVLLHSVAGQANLLEEALKAAIAEGRVSGVPILKVSFENTAAAEYLREPITVLDAPHRVFDAIFRDSEVPGANNNPTVGFSETAAGKAIATASLANATPLYEWSPTSLLFGCWNSANDKVPGKIKGNLKFARAIVSEIVGYEIEQGVRVGGKGDPAGITGQAIYRLPSDKPTTDLKEAHHGADGKPWFKKKVNLCNGHRMRPKLRRRLSRKTRSRKFTEPSAGSGRLMKSKPPGTKTANRSNGARRASHRNFCLARSRQRSARVTKEAVIGESFPPKNYASSAAELP